MRSTDTLIIICGIFVCLVVVNYCMIKLTGDMMTIQPLLFSIYGYLIWAAIVSAGMKISSEILDFILLAASACLFFIISYLIFAVKNKFSKIKIISTITISVPILLFVQLWTAFIFTCAGYGDCL
jgi:hypothetical protein